MNEFSYLTPLLVDKQKYEALQEYVGSLIQKEYTRLESLTDPIEFGRSQGRIQAYKVIKGLKDTLLKG